MRSRLLIRVRSGERLKSPEKKLKVGNEKTKPYERLKSPELIDYRWLINEGTGGKFKSLGKLYPGI